MAAKSNCGKEAAPDLTPVSRVARVPTGERRFVQRGRVDRRLQRARIQARRQLMQPDVLEADPRRTGPSDRLALLCAQPVVEDDDRVFESAEQVEVQQVKRVHQRAHVFRSVRA